MTATHQINVRHKDNNTCETSIGVQWMLRTIWVQLSIPVVGMGVWLAGRVLA